MLLVIACCGGLLLGSARGAVDMSSREVYRGLVGESRLEIDAKITDDVDATTRGRVHLKLDDVTIGDQKLPGRIFATVSNADGARRSDRVKIIGRVDQGFGNFVATITGVVAANDRASQSDMALNIRDGFAGHVQTAVHDPAASLGTGYLLGKKSALPDDLATALQVTGLTHIVVASGYNLTVLVRAGRRLFARVSKYLAMISGVGLVAGFVLMTGTSATMTRAGIVALLGRRGTGLRSGRWNRTRGRAVPRCSHRRGDGLLRAPLPGPQGDHRPVRHSPSPAQRPRDRLDPVLDLRVPHGASRRRRSGGTAGPLRRAQDGGRRATRGRIR